jgi:hypothetical protein
MMRFNRRKKRPLWVAIPLWGGLAMFAAWGTWQFAAFRQKLLADVPPPVRALPAADPDPGLDAQTIFLDDNRSTDPWADATTPVLGMVHPAAATADLREPLPGGPDNSRTPEEWMTAGTAFLNQGHIPQGRAALNAALQSLGDDPRAPLLRQQLTTLSEGVFLGSAVIPEDPAAPFIEIQPGDSFLKLGRKYAVPATLLEKLNPSLNPRGLKPGAGIKVVQGPFHLRYAKAARRLDLYVRDLYIKSFGAQVAEGDYLPLGVYRLKAASKITVGAKQWIGFEGASGDARNIAIGWIYGSSGPRLGRNNGLASGLKVGDDDLRQLYNALVEARSLLKVEP